MKRLRKGDPVVVISGNEKGNTGTIEAIKNGKVIVKGINKKKKHVKGDKSGKAGQIVEFEAPFNASNVAYSAEGKACKLKARFKEGKKEIYTILSGKEKVIRTQ